MFSIRIFFILMLQFLCSTALAQPGPGKTQQGEPLEWIEVHNHPGQYYMAQRTLSGKLKLTANESFFPRLGLVAQGKTPWPGSFVHLNQNKNFQSIGKWDVGEQAEWGLLFQKTGKLDITINMAASRPNRLFSLIFNDQTHAFTVPQERNGKVKAIHWTTTIKKPGRYSLIIQCDKNQAKDRTRFDFMKLSGDAASDACVLRKRWRPRAAHTKFTSSHAPKGVRLWIVEMDASPGLLDFYAPMTTPFGYFGPTWLADGRVNVGINFSLWSFKRGEKTPPIEKLSHMLAIGNRNAKFGGFDHEGTGVKVRNWQPLAGRQAQKQVLALRLEPGEVCDTYFSYFFDSTKKKWRFFAAGRKLKSRRLRNLYPGSFVEVPGRARVQRTGAYVRRMRYRGWVVDNKGILHPLDRMTFGDIDKKTGLTYTDRGVTKDGRFFLQTGGWVFRKKENAKYVEAPAEHVHTRTDFLGDADLKFLRALPSSIEGRKARRLSNSVAIEFEIRNRGENAEAWVYWGNAEGLTFTKKWAKVMKIDKHKEGKNRVILKGIRSRTKIFARFFLKNSKGQFWSSETMMVN